MAQRAYRPGSRNPRYRRFTKGEYTEQRMAWVETILGSQVLMYYPDPPPDEEVKEEGPTVRILMPQHRGPTVTWDLTYLTENELEKLREFFTLAFDTAAPIVRERDRIANEAFAAGDDSYSRGYRRVPQLVVRQRPERPHGEGVLDGHQGVPEGDGDSGGDSGRVRGSSGGLADAGQAEGEREDDVPPTD